LRTSRDPPQSLGPGPGPNGTRLVPRGKKEKDIRWSGCPSPPTPRGRGLCWTCRTAQATRSDPRRSRAAARVEHPVGAMRLPRGNGTRRPQACGCDFECARRTGVRVRNGPSARPRTARWITARDECHVRPPSEPGPGGVPGSSGPVASRRMMNLPARYASYAPLSSASIEIAETSSTAAQSVAHTAPTHGCGERDSRAARGSNFVSTDLGRSR